MPTIKINEKEFSSVLCTPCMICDSTIPLTPQEQDMLVRGMQFLKICDQCKSAVEWAKQHSEQGHWIMNSNSPDRLICSECNAQFDVWHWESKHMHYCPNCGINMKDDDKIKDLNGSRT